MLPEKEMRAVIRLFVAEHFASQLMAILYIASDYTDAKVAEVARGVAKAYAKQTFGGDPAISDLAAAEAEDAVRSLLDRAAELRASHKDRQAPGAK